MAKNKGSSQKQHKRMPNAIEVYEHENNTQQEKDATIAQAILRPSITAALTIKNQHKENDEITVAALTKELITQINRVNAGDMHRVEGMLVTQAHTLDSLFMELTRRAHLNLGAHIEASCKYLNLALKAQSNCRMTLEALAEVKNPKPYIQNNTAEYQQVNNCAPEPRVRAGNSKSTNGLLEDKAHEQEWLDTGAPETAGGNDKKLEAVETKHRTED